MQGAERFFFRSKALFFITRKMCTFAGKTEKSQEE
jgi:hypothetical protein